MARERHRGDGLNTIGVSQGVAIGRHNDLDVLVQRFQRCGQADRDIGEPTGLDQWVELAAGE